MFPGSNGSFGVLVLAPQYDAKQASTVSNYGRALKLLNIFQMTNGRGLFGIEAKTAVAATKPDEDDLEEEDDNVYDDDADSSSSPSASSSSSSSSPAPLTPPTAGTVMRIAFFQEFAQFLFHYELSPGVYYKPGVALQHLSGAKSVLEKHFKTTVEKVPTRSCQVAPGMGDQGYAIQVRPTLLRLAPTNSRVSLAPTVCCAS